MVWRLFFFCLIFTAPLSVNLSLNAQELSQYNMNKVKQALRLQQQDALSEAIELLRLLDPKKRYDKAYINRMLGVFYWQIGDSTHSLNYLSDAVKSKQLNDELAWSTQRMLADILLTEQRFSEALGHYYQLIELTKSHDAIKSVEISDVWLRIAKAHYYLKQWQKVLDAIEQYDRQNHDHQHRSQFVSVLSMKFNAQLKLRKREPAVITLTQLLELEPDKQYWWKQLAALQVQLNHHDNALNTLLLAQRQGIELNDSDIKLMAQLYYARGIPEKAAQMMSQLKGASRDVESLVMQAQYWQAAKEWEKSIVVWLKAAQLNTDYYWQVAQLQWQQGRYQQSIESLEKIILNEKMSAIKRSDIALLNTKAYYELNQIEKALRYAKKAEGIYPSHEAKEWIRYLSHRREK